MREVRVEEWAHAHPEQRLCSSRAGALSEGNFPESYTKKADEGLWMTPLRLSADHLSFLCSCTLRLSLRGEKAIPGILLQPQSLSCESSDEFLMCSDIKRENTIRRHTINSAQNRRVGLTCCVCSRHLWLYSLVYWTMKVGASKGASDWQQQLSFFEAVAHRRLETKWFDDMAPSNIYFTKHYLHICLKQREGKKALANVQQEWELMEASTGSAIYLSDLSAQHQTQHKNTLRANRWGPFSPHKSFLPLLS